MSAWDLKMPPALARIRTPEGIEALWREIASKVYAPPVLRGLPRYLDRIAWAFWEVDTRLIPRAMSSGDVALFVSFLIRLDQIDVEMQRCNYGVAKRASVLYARHLIEAMRQVAEQRLVAKGGVWPPTEVAPISDDSTAAGSDA